MFVVIMAFGMLIAAVGLWGFILPNSFVGVLQRFSRSAPGLYTMIGARLLLGAVLLIAAPLSRFSTLFYVLGVLSLFGALVTLMLGAQNIERYINWWVVRPAVYLRLLMLLAWLLGVFLVYASCQSLLI